jgi:Holliday junction DNA helicase RuvB
MDRRYLMKLASLHQGGPVGVETRSATLSKAVDTLEDVVEPCLQEGMIMRASRGRMLGQAGWEHLGRRDCGRAVRPRATARLTATA